MLSWVEHENCFITSEPDLITNNNVLYVTESSKKFQAHSENLVPYSEARAHRKPQEAMA